MGGEDFEGAAPGDARIGDGVEAAGVFVEGEFVEDAVAALAGLGVGAAGHAVDAAAAGELEDEGGGAFFVEGGFAEEGGAGVEEGGEALAVVEEEAGLQLVAAGDPGVAAGGGEGALAFDKLVGAAQVQPIWRDFSAILRRDSSCTQRA